ncbi:MAG TPA: thiamine-phosphate kinase [Tepidisphaeraceae bacterium]|jgi:thiamine-monophosphate kinase
MPNESDFLQWLRGQQRASELVELPAGDDLAILRWPADQLLVVGVDQVLEGVHFDLTQHSPRQVGMKVMNRNLSDCAAMACWPVAALASVALPKNRGEEFAREIYLGMKQAAEKFDCHIVGGDTSTWTGPLVASVSILGKASVGQSLLRSGARAGDSIYVSGALGGSLLGRHMSFVPRVELAIQIAGTGRATAMIDLSDGLSRDLPRICQESHVGAIVDAVTIPIHADAASLSQRDGLSPLDHALHDGEDYELLFTGRDLDSFGTRIGQITDTPGIFIQAENSRTSLEPRGWEHQW